MRFCLDLSHSMWRGTPDPVATARGTLALAAAADAGGIDAIWASEDPDGWDAFALLGAIAAVTGRARLGTGVVNPTARHPNQIAAGLATLDRLSGGRAVLGIGRGQPEWYERGLGVDAARPLHRVSETVALLRQWEKDGRASSADGDFFRIRDWQRSLGPVQRHVPVYLAAVGPKALALAGRETDGVIYNSLTSDDFIAETLPGVRAAAREAGRDPDALAVVLRTSVVVTDDPSRALQDAKSALSLINTLPGMDRAVEVAGWDVAAIFADARRAMGTDQMMASGGGFAALRGVADFAAARAAIPDGYAEQLMIAGPLATVRPRLARLAELGVTHVSVRAPADASAAGWQKLLVDLGAP